MKLTAKEIFALSHGALRYEEQADGAVRLCRFTEKTVGFYEATNQNFATKTKAGACIRLEFDTDADEFTVGYAISKASSRSFFYFDIFVDGVMVAHPGQDNLENAVGELSLELPAGTHRVAIYLPNLACADITHMTFPDGATVKPVEKSLKLYALGDSITQGYDAEYPSQSYANLLTDKLNATTVNHGIGGEIFNPGMLDAAMDFAPDIITVAYGTNDWSTRTAEDFKRDADEYYRLLRVTYPTAKIFAITPIWRADKSNETKAGCFENAVRIVTEAALAQPGVVVIDGDKMIPHLAAVCSDAYLHPNDFGFKFYAEALFDAMKPHLG